MACLKSSVLALTLLVPAAAAAQSARVSGTLTDASGGVLPGAKVSASLADLTGETRSVMTSPTGAYEMVALRAGRWTLTTELPGFEKQTRVITLQDGQSIDWTLALPIGEVQETITVSLSDAPRTPPAAPPAMRPAPAASPTATATPPRNGAVRVGGNIRAPRKTSHTNPVYPADMAGQNVAGVVVLKGIIDTDGLVRGVEVVRSPNGSFAQAASAAFGDWQFSPTLLNGVPVQTRMTGTFNFVAK